MVYGAMGGDGQPQTPAAVFTRYVQDGRGAAAGGQRPALAARPRLGSMSESRFAPSVVEDLRGRRHVVDVVGAFDETAGHAGVLVRHASGMMEGAYDPRSDGAAAGF